MVLLELVEEMIEGNTVEIEVCWIGNIWRVEGGFGSDTIPQVYRDGGLDT